MKNLYITDSRELYQRSSIEDKILYEYGLVANCSFIDKQELQDFNNTIVGLENEAYRMMLIQLDQDIKTISDLGLEYKANKFIENLNPIEKGHSTLYSFHEHFVIKKDLFYLVINKFIVRYKLEERPIILSMSEQYYLTQGLPLNIESFSYYKLYKNMYLNFLLKQVYYFFVPFFHTSKKIQKTDIAIFLFDINNSFDIFKKYVDLIQKQDKLKLTFVVIDSGTPKDRAVDTSIYEKGNVSVVRLYKEKRPFYFNYKEFYKVCEKVNPLYSIFKKARICETQNTQYGFTDHIISQLSPDVCMYGMTHEYGRVLSNVCKKYNIPSVCVDYASLFDIYFIEKRIKYDVRACMSEVSSFNWRKHNDPSTRHEVIGFCKIDEWREKLNEKKENKNTGLFDNNHRTILFISTYSPHINSPILKEKALITQQLSEMCHRNNWNLIIKKHPAEFDTLADDVLKKNQYPNQLCYQHSEMTLFDCIYHSDFVCTQNSTAYVEVLYLNKPFSYITVIGDTVWINASYFSKEKEVHTFSSIFEYEQYLLENVKELAYESVMEEFKKLQSKYLFRTDGMASERLLELTSSFVTR